MTWLQTCLSYLTTKTNKDIELRTISSNGGGVRDRLFSRNIEEIQAFVTEHEHENCYYGVYTRDGGGTKESVREAWCLFADMDFKLYKGGSDEARKAIKSFEYRPSMVVFTGNGWHVYWFLKDVIPNAYENKDYIEGILRGIAKAIGSDPSVAEIARILRIPDTYNYKCIPPAKVNVLQFAPQKEYDIRDFEKYMDIPSVKSAEGPSMSLGTILKKCDFLKYCYENGNDLPEPLWYAMISNLARLVNGVGLCHEFSTGYTKYSRAETDKKILHAINASAPMTCSTIKDLMKSYLSYDCGKENCGYKCPASVIIKKEFQYDIQKGDEKFTITPFRDALQSTLQYVINRKNDPGGMSGIPTGFSKLDEILDGLQPGNLILISARPSVGKSALALNIANNCSAEFPCAIISLEMTDTEQTIRIMASESEVSINSMRRGEITDDQLMLLQNNAKVLGDRNNIFFVSGTSTAEGLAEATAFLVNEYGCKLVIVDHIHLMGTKVAQQNREREISKISQMGKKLAKDFNIPMVFLAQLNREVEKARREPVLSDLRDSGSLEQDADVIIFLHPSEVEGSNKVVKMILAKGRNTGTGEMYYRYRGEFTKFYYDPDYDVSEARDRIAEMYEFTA